MTNNHLTRRDFLKALGVSSLALSGLLGLSQVSAERDPANQKLPNILILVFDTLSAQDLSLYGFPRQTTPNLVQAAKHATVYHRHYSGGNFTTPGTASLFTGVYPWTHRAINLQGQTTDQFANNNIFSLLPKEYHRFAYTHNTLAYILLDQFHSHIGELLKISDLALYSDLWVDRLPISDFTTALEAELLLLKNDFSVNGSLFLSKVDDSLRMRQSLRLNQTYRKEFPRGLPNCRTGEQPGALCFTLEETFDWLQKKIEAQTQPFFGYIHVLPPHAPYNPRQDFIGRFNGGWEPPVKPVHFFGENNRSKTLSRLRRQFDETIAYTDSEFGRLMNFLEQNQFLQNTCLVVTSDHGEMLERGVSGHNNPLLYEPIIHIPLVIFYPGQDKPQDIYSPTSAVDLLPTLLQLAGANLPGGLEGQVLPGYFLNKSNEDQTVYTVEAKSSPKQGPLKKATFALIQEQYKLIYSTGYPGYEEIYELYDLWNDPEEINNIFSPTVAVAKDLKDQLKAQLAQFRSR
jgi:arylsulfatase A-like enzyme